MPKEVAHWVIADRVIERLPEGPLADAARRHPNCVRLGAVFHDVGYYSREAEPKQLEALADTLHGARGEDTNRILRQLSPVLSAVEAAPWLAAFLVGLATHIVADRHLHPLIYYFTGNYYDRDPRRQRTGALAHRRLEALMDLRVAGGPAGVQCYSLGGILRNLEVPASELLDEVASQLEAGGSPVSTAQLLAALGFFSKVQWLVRRPFLTRVLGLPLRLSPANRETLYSLTYSPDLEAFTELLIPPLEYRNPYSGELHREPLSEAIDSIVEDGVALCVDLASSSAPLRRGESLEVGIASAAAADATHFHPYVVAQDQKKIADFETLRSSR